MEKPITLFCLPFAGGNKYSYRPLLAAFPSFLNIVSLDYPGHGNRTREPLCNSIDELVNDLYNTILPQINNTNYAFFGHSLGSLVAFLLTKKMVAENKPLPTQLILSGAPAPSAAFRKNKKRHLLGTREFLDEIKLFGGMPEEVLNNEELLYYFEPILRCDFKISENYIYEKTEALKMPFTVITGTGEEFEETDVQPWKDETTGNVEFIKMEGGHFFIYDHIQSIAALIAGKLNIVKAVN